MKIEKIHIKNLRSFSDVEVPLNSCTCLVGPNGAGKSTVLYALNIFFRENDNTTTDLNQLDKEDFHQKNTNENIEITVTFIELDKAAQTDFFDYYRHDKLIISAVATFNNGTGKVDIKQYGQRLGMEEFKEFFRAAGDNKKVADLKTIYGELRGKYHELPASGTKESMSQSLREYEKSHYDKCVIIPSEDQFYGVSKGANRLAKYIQWVYVPAVKDATTEQMEARNTSLGKLLALTVRAKTNFDASIKDLRSSMQKQYQDLLDINQHILENISTSLQTRLTEWAHPEAKIKLQWRQDPEKSVRVEEPWARIIAGEGAFEGDLARFGHGLQRSYLLALLHELAIIDDTSAPKLILGCEEPELYQHPPQARHLAAVIERLSKGNAQVIISTHSPFFVSGDGFENVRMVRKDHVQQCSNITYTSYEDIARSIADATGERLRKSEGVLAKINQLLQPSLNEMFFATRLILVEGLEDVAYISTYLNLLGKWEEYRRLGCHIVPVNGKSEMLQPIIIAKHMKIPTFVIFDSDADKDDRNGSREKHEKDNRAILTLLGKKEQNPMPSLTIWESGFVMWKSDIGKIVSEDIGIEDWKSYQEDADRKYGQVGGLRKNYLHIAASLVTAYENGKKSPNLCKLCESILNNSNTLI